ncbi:putative acetyltransferase [Corynebacterium kutscheri]|uniref:Predicted acetyltransferase n=2 Tax=Corynebacterium kutscheri TaxID=35755 RepID=A0A0F6TCH1_9CORY|nr:putative acetyltransferase [Corynebacterium kutscheri]VEH04467.1 predicted acetyltransferase [Corynebacterium kutscheri]VEH09101.1 predicted acetyltransferase [Corynebacterium kutscheri]
MGEEKTMSEIIHDADKHRFLLRLDTVTAGFADYRMRGDEVRIFYHTVIHPEFRGRGLSKTLIQAALENTRVAGLKVVPTCSAVAAFMEKDPQYNDIRA